MRVCDGRRSLLYIVLEEDGDHRGRIGIFNRIALWNTCVCNAARVTDDAYWIKPEVRRPIVWLRGRNSRATCDSNARDMICGKKCIIF